MQAAELYPNTSVRRHTARSVESTRARFVCIVQAQTAAGAITAGAGALDNLLLILVQPAASTTSTVNSRGQALFL